jgi:hydrogenase nickel incorporation protein HypA/HybF
MHEQSIVESLLNLVLEKAHESNAQKVLRIYLVVGELSGVEETAVEFYFGFLGQNTIADKAELFFMNVPAELRCKNCGNVYKFENRKLNCPVCKKNKVEIISGRELYLDSIEVE